MEVAKTETIVKRYDSSGNLLDTTTTIIENGEVQQEETSVLIGLYL